MGTNNNPEIENGRLDLNVGYVTYLQTQTLQCTLFSVEKYHQAANKIRFWTSLSASHEYKQTRFIMNARLEHQIMAGKHENRQKERKSSYALFCPCIQGW